MALPPTIPTSFVPKQPVASSVRKHASINPFLALAYFVLAVAVAGAASVFAYRVYLKGVVAQRAQAVQDAQNRVDQATVTEFIRLRDRFLAAKDLLNSHIALSQFFNTLEATTLAGTHISKLQVTLLDDRTATVNLSGTARSFNTLAAQSAELAKDKRVKRVIFSNIASVPEGISYQMTAQLDPAITVQQPASAASLPPADALPEETATTTAP